MSRNRKAPEVIRDILAVIKGAGGSIRPTQLIYKANLNGNVLKEKMSYLIEKGCVEMRDVLINQNTRMKSTHKTWPHITIKENGYIMLNKLEEEINNDKII